MATRLNVALAISIAIGSSGCTAIHAVKGVAATDLSGLSVGMPQSQVEQLLGEPIDTRQYAWGETVHYRYDGGYIPPAEKNDQQVAAAAFLAGAGLMTGGLVWIMDVNCQYDCQVRQLAVIFDEEGKLVGASSHGFYRPGYCGTGKSVALCNAVGASPRPATLPEELESEFQSFIVEHGGP
jgi:hypothetical protein